MTTLKDLRTLNPLHPGAITGGGEVFPATRPATLSDLREVLEGLGAKRVWWCGLTRINKQGEVLGALPGSSVWWQCLEGHGHADDSGLGCGWRLVVRLDTLETQ